MPRPRELLDRLLPIVSGGICAYGASLLLVRLFETVLLRNAIGLAWAPWDILLLVFGFGGAAATFKVNSPKW